MTAASDPSPLIIARQGSYAVGGSVKSVDDPEYGELTLHGDHAFIRYQVPVDARPLPLTFLHGTMQFSKTWETTPDGREGFQNIFLRRGYGVYLVDQPRRGDAGQTTDPIMIESTPEDQKWFNVFRIGLWPDYFPGVQFSRDPATLDQYFRQITPNTGPFDLAVVSDAMAAHFEKSGPGILVTHSQGGGVGWDTALKSSNVRAVVSYEPASNFIFPQEFLPEPMVCSGGILEGRVVSQEDFMRITKIPVVIYYGDNITEERTENTGQDLWRIRLAMARVWAEVVNAYGGDVTVIHLPQHGVHGNTHFPFSDTNNLEVADLMEAWLQSRDLG